MLNVRKFIPFREWINEIRDPAVLRADLLAGIVTFVTTLGFAPHLDKGIMIGAGLSIVLYLDCTMKPRVAILGGYKGGTLRDLRVHPELPTDD